MALRKLSQLLSVLFVCVNFFNVPPIFASPAPTNLKLELVQVLLRHGARTPVDCEFKLVPNGNETLYDPWGMAQLTTEGMMQEYKIGEMLRERYDDFLPYPYKPEHVYAYASGLARTKASAQLVLAALYPPTEELTWNSKLNWLPIPINFIPRPLDILVKSRDCPKYSKTLDEVYSSKELKEAVAKHDIRKMLEKIYGQTFDFEDVNCAYNAFLIHTRLKLPLPDWFDAEILTKLRKAAEFHFDNLSYNQNLKRLNGGTVVRRFVENINSHNARLNKRKIYLYSAHDKTLHAYLKSHNFTLSGIPDYGSAIILEKFRDEQNKFYVRLLYWTGSPKKLNTLKLENCAELCPYEQYLRLIRPSIPSDEEMRCLLNNLTAEDLERILITDKPGIDD